ADKPVEGFVHLLFIGDGDGIWSHPHNVIVAGRASQLTVVETYVGRGKYFTNAVTEVFAADGAVVDHYKIECESREAFHVGTVQVRQGRASSVISRNVSVGGALVRNDINAVLDGEGASLSLDGLFVLGSNQHVDNHTLIDHVSPRAESHELYKGILDDNARGIFDGRIIVRPNAQKTVSRQENRNLLLSEAAIVDSKPTLEIHNDDVKCNHGSTIGQIDEQAMFYLRSRGIGEDEARNLLVYAFASEIVDRMKIEPVKEQVRRALFQHLPERLPERRDEDRGNRS
ncbi:MAG TPA: Fe-S cluster assembly protein SufD, partial [Thermoanaerobaculia bacterium]